MERILSDGKFNTHTRKGAFQVVVGCCYVLCTDIDGVGVELSQDAGKSFLHEAVYIHRVNILVVNDVQQVGEPVATTVDDVQTVA